MKDDIQENFAMISRAINNIANSITPLDASPASVGDGQQVGSLTEAIMYLADSITNIADAIRDHAQTMDSAISCLKPEE